MAGAPAPVALFAYRRPDHLRRSLASLAVCPEAATTSLVVFCDGPRSAADAPDVAEVRRLARAVEGFASVEVVEQSANRGLAASVIAGVSEVLSTSPSVIVLEDDMVVSEDFLAYMNAGLVMYADDERVVSIHGYVYPTEEPLPQTFFLRGADCWGWATWQRGWARFDPDGSALLAGLERAGLTEAFDFDGAFPYTQMLRDQVAGQVDSWAIRWYASAYLADLLTLYPGRSLVENIGLDGSGTHSRGGRGLATRAGVLGVPERIPVEESTAARAVVARALRGQRRRWPRLPRWRRA
jgi:hypothetical protein